MNKLTASLFIVICFHLPAQAKKSDLQLCIDACYEASDRPSAELKACVNYCQTHKSGSFVSRLNAATKPSQIRSQDLVLGVSLDPSEAQFHFPCSAYQNVVFCEADLSFVDPVCGSSLRYQRVKSGTIAITCRTKTAGQIMIAETVGDLTIDSTQDAFGSVRLMLNPRIFLNKNQIQIQ